VPNLSIGRVGHDLEWGLTVPSFGSENVDQPQGDPSTLRINEWLARGEVILDNDFVELFNPDSLHPRLGDHRHLDGPRV
jgi:hypothetical protein